MIIIIFGVLCVCTYVQYATDFIITNWQYKSWMGSGVFGRRWRPNTVVLPGPPCALYHIPYMLLLSFQEWKLFLLFAIWPQRDRRQTINLNIKFKPSVLWGVRMVTTTTTTTIITIITTTARYNHDIIEQKELKGFCYNCYILKAIWNIKLLKCWIDVLFIVEKGGEFVWRKKNKLRVQSPSIFLNLNSKITFFSKWAIKLKIMSIRKYLQPY